MPALTSAILGGAGLVSSGIQAFSGAKTKRQGQHDLQNYERQDLSSEEANPYRNLQVSTVGSDAMREENQRTSANTIDALRSAGTRGLAMLPSVVATNNNANNDTRNYLDSQIIDRNKNIADDDVRLRGMTESRENADLAGIGNEIQVGNQDMWSGIRGMGNSVMSMANSGAFSGSPTPMDPIGKPITPNTTLNPLTPNNQITAPALPSYLGKQPYSMSPYLMDRSMYSYPQPSAKSIVNSNYGL